MNLLDYFRRQFSYNAWANREVLNSLDRDDAMSQSLYLFSHVLSAERLWLARIRQHPQSFPVWPHFTVEECGTQTDETGSSWRNYLDEVDPSQLSNEVAYRNTKGERWTNSVHDILTHVLLHSAYHRGQIAKEMRAQGKQPVYTDFIQAARQGSIK
jgi:uncharacterized damage-inducible protein DinB